MPPNDPASPGGRFAEIDIAKGIAIVLVVFGHLVARDIWPTGNAWYAAAHSALYTFHMAFFFYLAGYVFWTAASNARVARALNATRRMLPAYFLFAAIVFVAKLTAGYVVPVDRPIGAAGSMAAEWLLFFLYPTEGFITFLWFVIALLGIYALTLLALKLSPKHFGVILLVALALHLLSVGGYVTKALALHQIARYWLFFLLARWSFDHRHAVLILLRRSWWLWLLSLATLLSLITTPWLNTLAALLALPALHGLALAISETRDRRWIARLLAVTGACSWPIYLMNVLAIGAIKAVILKTVGWDGLRFLVVAPALLIAGLTLPLLVQRQLFSRLAWLDRITR